MKKLSLVVIALFVPVLALQAEESMPSLFEHLDTDKNGMVSKEESKNIQELVAMFESLDINGDGQLSPTEFEAAVRS